MSVPGPDRAQLAGAVRRALRLLPDGLPQRPVAYCAPGRTAITVLALALAGEAGIDVVETPAMAGRKDALVCRHDQIPSLAEYWQWPGGNHQDNSRDRVDGQGGLGVG